jgi:hypothetical protein
MNMRNLVDIRTAAWVFFMAAITFLPMAGVSPAYGAKLVAVRTVDDQYLMIHWLDGEIQYKDDGEGPKAFMGHESGGGDTVKRYDPALDTKATGNVANYTLKSVNDANYAAATPPAAAFRRSKVNGTTLQWPEPEYTVEHTIFLRLPHKLQQGKRYTLGIAAATNSDTTSRDLTFDVFSNVSEALHVNLIGYNPAHTTMKSADLYMWLGDGGARDYSDYVGRKVMLYDVDSGRKHDVGTVAFWKKRSNDYGNWDLTKSTSGRATFQVSPARAATGWR